MKLLLHTCCGPCLLYPLRHFIEKCYKVTGYFYNPNIHPYKEFQRRLNSLKEVSQELSVPLIVDRDYGFVEFSRKVVFNEENRCLICYDMRLEKTARYAKKEGFSHFSTTLLYSRYQNHQVIKEKCNELAKKFDILFHYHDFREGWQRGIDESIERSLYRQPYCGCVYSEQERYDNRLKKRLKKNLNK